MYPLAVQGVSYSGYEQNHGIAQTAYPWRYRYLWARVYRWRYRVLGTGIRAVPGVGCSEYELEHRVLLGTGVSLRYRWPVGTGVSVGGTGSWFRSMSSITGVLGTGISWIMYLSALVYLEVPECRLVPRRVGITGYCSGQACQLGYRGISRHGLVPCRLVPEYELESGYCSNRRVVGGTGVL